MTTTSNSTVRSDSDLRPCPDCPICGSVATWETALTANVGGKEVVYGSCSECSCTAEYHDWLIQNDVIAALQQRVRGLTQLLDDVIGTPCEQIRADQLREANAAMSVAVEPFVKACSALVAAYGADRPDHQWQTVMIQMSDVKALLNLAYPPESGS